MAVSKNPIRTSMRHRDMSIVEALCSHWPEYLIEGGGLGCLMISVGILISLLHSSRSPLYSFLPAETFRDVILALSVGATLTLLIHSSWGKRSGAHMNPAITLAFLRLGRIGPWDALFFVIAHFIGGTLGVLAVASLLGPTFTDPPIEYAVTLPGQLGVFTAFAAEVLISFLLMSTILLLTSSAKRIRFTGVAVGALVALFILTEAPLSGTSMNPARTLASAIPSGIWRHVWLYIVGPPLGMLAAAELNIHMVRSSEHACAKLLHPRDVRCIHCGVDPPWVGRHPNSPFERRCASWWT